MQIFIPFYPKANKFISTDLYSTLISIILATNHVHKDKLVLLQVTLKFKTQYYHKDNDAQNPQNQQQEQTAWIACTAVSGNNRPRTYLHCRKKN